MKNKETKILIGSKVVAIVKVDGIVEYTEDLYLLSKFSKELTIEYIDLVKKTLFPRTSTQIENLEFAKFLIENLTNEESIVL